MILDYSNPDHWGRSRLTDKALQMQQFRAENPEQWKAMIKDDLDALTIGEPIVTPDPLVMYNADSDTVFSITSDHYLTSADNSPDIIHYYPASENPYNGFTTINETPNPLSHGQFLGNFAGEVEPETIWRLGEGDETALDEISNPVTRERAKTIFDRIDGMGYWDDQSGDSPTG